MTSSLVELDGQEATGVLQTLDHDVSHNNHQKRMPIK